MMGTYVNAAAVIFGGIIGLTLNRELPERIKSIIFQGIGLVTLFLGIQMALKSENLVILFFSILIGAVIGEAMGLEKRLENFGNFLKAKIKSGDENFSEGLVTAFLIFCIGSMTIVGAIEDGLRGDPSILIAKSILDGFVSISLASALGVGVIFSSIPLFIYQGSITLLAAYAKVLFTKIIVNELSAAGGILLLGLGIKMLEIKEVKVANLLLSLAVAPILVQFLS